MAFSELDVPATGHGPGHQSDTLVVREHRGHGLGLLVKAANLERLRRETPGITTISTFNAEDNVPMIAVNDRLGFRTIGVEGNWRKVAE